MKIFLAIDKRNGMMFNRRRQSQDVKLREHILSVVADSKLMMNAYSFKQFKDMDVSNIIVSENFLEGTEDVYYFVENLPIAPHLTKIDIIYLCKWNRDYPSDMKFDVDLTQGFKLISTVEIMGNSHKKITIEEWEKEK